MPCFMYLDTYPRGSGQCIFRGVFFHTPSRGKLLCRPIVVRSLFTIYLVITREKVEIGGFLLRGTLAEFCFQGLEQGL